MTKSKSTLPSNTAKRLMYGAGLLLCLSATSQAATFYVNDELTITLRTGESTQHQILRTLTSGTAINIISHNSETGYSLARLKDGTEGYVLTRYLVDKPVARDQLAAAQRKAEQLDQKVAELQSQLTELQQQSGIVSDARSSLDQQNTELKMELDHIRSISSSALAINEQNQQLNSRIINLETTIQTLEQENLILQDRSARDWFIAGVGVALLGIIIGLIAPRLSFKKRSSWNQL